MSNRTTVKSNIQALNVPTVTNAILNTMLQSEMSDNLVFREDVVVSQSASVSAITVDFTGKDRIDLTRLSGTLNITLSGLGDGDVKYLLITKTVGQAVTFTGGAVDITPLKVNIDALSSVLYEIVRKGSNYFAKAWYDTIVDASTTTKGVQENATATEAQDGSSATLTITPSVLQGSESWQAATVGAGWSATAGGTVSYKKNLVGDIEIKGEVQYVSGGVIFQLPLGYRPQQAFKIACCFRDVTDVNDSGWTDKVAIIEVSTNGQLTLINSTHLGIAVGDQINLGRIVFRAD